MNERPSNPQATIRQRWRFAFVLVAVLMLAVGQPLTAGLMGDEGSFDVFFSLLIGAVMLPALEEQKHRIAVITFGLIAILGIWIGYAMNGVLGRVFLVGSNLLAAGVFAFALYRIIRAILMKQASGDAIFGAVCGYLLLGMIWALVYAAVETASPGSFTASVSSKVPVVAGRLDRNLLSYYSFITLTTVGYGDVTPATPLARNLSWIEAVTGQFYLAILVAGLVGIKVTQAIQLQTRSQD